MWWTLKVPPRIRLIELTYTVSSLSSHNALRDEVKDPILATLPVSLAKETSLSMILGKNFTLSGKVLKRSRSATSTHSNALWVCFVSLEESAVCVSVV